MPETGGAHCDQSQLSYDLIKETYSCQDYNQIDSVGRGSLQSVTVNRELILASVAVSPPRLPSLFDECIPGTLDVDSIAVSQSFGDRDIVREADRIGAIDFSQCGTYLLSGDNGGRIVIFANDNNKGDKACTDHVVRDYSNTEAERESDMPNSWKPFYQFQGKHILPSLALYTIFLLLLKKYIFLELI